MASESQRQRLPFEPKRSRKKTAKTTASAPTAPASPPQNTAQRSPQRSPKSAAAPKTTANVPVAASDRSAPPPRGTARGTTAAARIPDAVSNRMIRRMMIFCGIPTSLGIASFIGSYLVVSHEWFPLPNIAVVIMSMGCFGLGVLGLSYGVLSASWDEAVAGSWFGWDEFTTNTGRMVAAWRSRSVSPEESAHKPKD